MTNAPDYSLLLDIGKYLLIPIAGYLGAVVQTLLNRRTASKNTVVDQIFALVQKITDDNTRLRTERDEIKTRADQRQRIIDALEYQKRNILSEILYFQIDIQQAENGKDETLACALQNMKNRTEKMTQELKPYKGPEKNERALESGN